MACSGRHHRWTAYPPTIGTPCALCPRIYAGVGFQRAGNGKPPAVTQPPEAPAAPPLLVETAPPPLRPSIAEMFRATSPAPPVPVAAAAAPPPPPMPAGWTKVIGPRLARAALLGTGRLAEYTSTKDKRYEAGELDDDTEQMVEDSVTTALAHWFPDAALSPGKQVLVALTLAFGEQWIGRTEIEAEETTATSPAPATRATATTEDDRDVDTVDPVEAFGV